MDYEVLANRLQVVRRPLRVAFGAACVGRILIIHELCKSDGPTEALEEALSLAWVFASGAAPYPDPELGGGSEHCACSAVACALDVLFDESGKSAALAATWALQTISNMGDEEGVAEEAEWHERALAIVEDWPEGRTIDPQMFDPISETEPAWRTRWVES